MDIGNIFTVSVVSLVGLLMFLSGVFEIRRFFLPRWRIGYGRTKPSLFFGVASFAIGSAMLALAFAKLVVGE
jgi:uncharacterized membrane protein HdeD (DUF308 family)